MRILERWIHWRYYHPLTVMVWRIGALVCKLIGHAFEESYDVHLDYGIVHSVCKRCHETHTLRLY